MKDTKNKKQIEEIPTDKNGRIMENSLFKLLYGNRFKDRDKSVLSSNAHYATLCEPGNVPGASILALANYKEKILADSEELYYLLHLMQVTGLRISEALAINPADISPDGRLLIKSLKGSDIRIVQDSELMGYLSVCRERKKKPFQTFNRFFVYRYMKKLGIAEYFGDNRKASVTHLFRHLAVLDMKTLDPTLQAAKRAIGHKSIKSTEHYAKDKKAKRESGKRRN